MELVAWLLGEMRALDETLVLCKTKSLRDEIARGAGDEILPAAGRNPPPVSADEVGPLPHNNNQKARI